MDTILNYFEFCRKAFIIKKTSRYDTIGKKILKVDEKHYLTNHRFRQARGFSNTKDIETTRVREFGGYKTLDDNFPKYILAMDRIFLSKWCNT